MMKGFMRRLILLAAPGLLLVPGAARAGLLEGHQLQVQEIVGGSPVPAFTTTFTVSSAPGAVEVANWGGAGQLSLDFFDTGSKTSALLIHGLSSTTFGPSPNLLRISEPVVSLPAIASVGVTPLSPDLQNFDFLSRVDAGPGFATFDLGGLTFTPQSALRFDVTFDASSNPGPVPGPVPDPHPGPGQGQGSGSGQGQGHDPGPKPSDAPEPGTLGLLLLGGLGCLAGAGRGLCRRNQGRGRGDTTPTPA
jgi:hypothetical protein